jgi:hypothetical protein
MTREAARDLDGSFRPSPKPADGECLDVGVDDRMERCFEGGADHRVGWSSANRKSPTA